MHLAVDHHVKYSDVVETVLCVLSTRFRKVSSSRRSVFAQDLAAVGLSIRLDIANILFIASLNSSSSFRNLLIVTRAAHLVDAVVLPDPGGLLSDLREKEDTFRDVFIIVEPSSQNVFFVNSHLVHLNLENGLKSSLYVNLRSDGPYLRSEVPQKLLDVASVVLARLEQERQTPDLIHLPEGLPQDVVVPLAGLLLEYPVVYVPPSDQSSFLSNVPLEVYEFALTLRDADIGYHKQHTLLKFSCPSALASHAQSLIEKLTSCLQGRLACIQGSPMLKLQQKTETLDRVAL